MATEWGIEHENAAKEIIFQYFQALMRIELFEIED